MVKVQCTRESEITPVCVSLDVLPVLEVGWRPGAEATGCLNLQSCQCSGSKEWLFMVFLWIFMVFS